MREEFARGIGRDRHNRRRPRRSCFPECPPIPRCPDGPRACGRRFRPARRNDCPACETKTRPPLATGRIDDRHAELRLPQLLAGRGVEREDVAEAGGDEHLPSSISDAAAEALGRIDRHRPSRTGRAIQSKSDVGPLGREVACPTAACRLPASKHEDMRRGVEHDRCVRRRRPAARSGGNRRRSPCRHPASRSAERPVRFQMIHRVGGIAAGLRPVRVADRAAAARRSYRLSDGSGFSASSSDITEMRSPLSFDFFATRTSRTRNSSISQPPSASAQHDTERHANMTDLFIAAWHLGCGLRRRAICSAAGDGTVPNIRIAARRRGKSPLLPRAARNGVRRCRILSAMTALIFRSSPSASRRRGNPRRREFRAPCGCHAFARIGQRRQQRLDFGAR